mmetsp:Transcript_38637/g.114746  ORF Transcript_38637/g.114746 Transcript_38637/m.114746 type:complete len:610 (-) Transcript_38637:1122-2951(-)
MCRELRCKALRLLLLRDQPRLVCLRLVSKHKLVLLQVLTLAPQHLDGCIVVSHDLVSLLELVAKLANRDLLVVQRVPQHIVIRHQPLHLLGLDRLVALEPQARALEQVVVRLEPPLAGLRHFRRRHSALLQAVRLLVQVGLCLLGVFCVEYLKQLRLRLDAAEQRLRLLKPRLVAGHHLLDLQLVRVALPSQLLFHAKLQIVHRRRHLDKLGVLQLQALLVQALQLLRRRHVRCLELPHDALLRRLNATAQALGVRPRIGQRRRQPCVLVLQLGHHIPEGLRLTEHLVVRAGLGGGDHCGQLTLLLVQPHQAVLVDCHVKRGVAAAGRGACGCGGPADANKRALHELPIAHERYAADHNGAVGASSYHQPAVLQHHHARQPKRRLCVQPDGLRRRLRIAAGRRCRHVRAGARGSRPCVREHAALRRGRQHDSVIPQQCYRRRQSARRAGDLVDDAASAHVLQPAVSAAHNRARSGPRQLRRAAVDAALVHKLLVYDPRPVDQVPEVHRAAGARGHQHAVVCTEAQAGDGADMALEDAYLVEVVSVVHHDGVGAANSGKHAAAVAVDNRVAALDSERSAQYEFVQCNAVKPELRVQADQQLRSAWMQRAA